jgi:predicted 3-demethylubiquinone-9 3-methyltransferase (glyoxalase superfamily)
MQLLITSKLVLHKFNKVFFSSKRIITKKSKGDKMTKLQKITPNLWFDKEASEAAKFYTSIFKDSKIKNSTLIHNTPSGTAEIITLDILGQEFIFISAGPYFKFNESISFVIFCETQEEIDYYWEKLSFIPEAEQCGWLKDKFGVSWQIEPLILKKMLCDKDSKKVAKVTEAFLKMKKFNIRELEKAYNY